ncbi:hypothetical protein C8R43DRAFT_943612 [Mycena crocata]|nr:hypothetical protein C8R43DRAFT_943607 [Mycena crocata]KAJ7173978.1 hypothetical protein C8R43DRAFT_943612 [Mycena crocata]
MCAGAWCRSGEFGKHVASIPQSDLYDLCWDLGVNSRPRRHRPRIPVAPSPAPPLNSVISQNANAHCKTHRNIDYESPSSANTLLSFNPTIPALVQALCRKTTDSKILPSFPQFNSIQFGLRRAFRAASTSSELVQTAPSLRDASRYSRLHLVRSGPDAGSINEAPDFAHFDGQNCSPAQRASRSGSALIFKLARIYLCTVGRGTRVHFVPFLRWGNSFFHLILLNIEESASTPLLPEWDRSLVLGSMDLRSTGTFVARSISRDRTRFGLPLTIQPQRLPDSRDSLQTPRPDTWSSAQIFKFTSTCKTAGFIGFATMHMCWRRMRTRCRDTAESSSRGRAMLIEFLSELLDMYADSLSSGLAARGSADLNLAARLGARSNVDGDSFPQLAAQMGTNEFTEWVDIHADTRSQFACDELRECGRAWIQNTKASHWWAVWMVCDQGRVLTREVQTCGPAGDRCAGVLREKRRLRRTSRGDKSGTVWRMLWQRREREFSERGL